MENTQYRALRGEVVLVGKEIDGDTVHVRLEHPEHCQGLERAGLLRTEADGSIPVRLEAVDAPESHFQGAAQPLGSTARDRLLVRLGFQSVRFSPENPSRITAASPEGIPVVLLSRGFDAWGRLVAFLFPRDAGALPLEGTEVELSPELLRPSVNVHLLAEGAGYYTVYSSTPEAVRGYLRRVAQVARDRKKGVWEKDATQRFVLTGTSLLAPSGALILPKLFRRVVAYLKAQEQGFSGSLVNWLRSPTHLSRDDQLRVGNATDTTTLSTLLVQQGRVVHFMASPLSLTFLSR